MTTPTSPLASPGLTVRTEPSTIVRQSITDLRRHNKGLSNLRALIVQAEVDLAYAKEQAEWIAGHDFNSKAATVKANEIAAEGLMLATWRLESLQAIIKIPMKYKQNVIYHQKDARARAVFGMGTWIHRNVHAADENVLEWSLWLMHHR